jgi:hypothetical protein
MHHFHQVLAKFLLWLASCLDQICPSNKISTPKNQPPFLKIDKLCPKELIPTDFSPVKSRPHLYLYLHFKKLCSCFVVSSSLNLLYFNSSSSLLQYSILLFRFRFLILLLLHLHLVNFVSSLTVLLILVSSHF